MGDLNAKPAKKKKMLSPTAGFALKSPMPLVSRGGLDAGQKKKMLCPTVGFWELNLGFSTDFCDKKTKPKIQKSEVPNLFGPCQRFITHQKILEQNTTPSQCDRADFKKTCENSFDKTFDL